MKQVVHGRWRQEDQEFKANLNKIMSSMEVRTTQTLSQKAKQQK